MIRLERLLSTLRRLAGDDSISLTVTSGSRVTMMLPSVVKLDSDLMTVTVTDT